MAAVAGHAETSHEHNYDAAVEDFRRDLSMSPQQGNEHFSTAPAQMRDIDEEIKVAKKRRPVAKLDAERLLSQKGVPELRRRTTKRLRFKGKGHEYSDIAALLSMYQIWLDDLYPRAKFRDGLGLVEKVGHTKRLQVMRKEWMKATRPTQTIEEEEQETEQRQLGQEVPRQVEKELNIGEQEQASIPSIEEDGVQSHRNEEAELDDLDALMAEEDSLSASKDPDASSKDKERDDHFADEEEAMAEMGW